MGRPCIHEQCGIRGIEDESKYCSRCKDCVLKHEHNDCCWCGARKLAGRIEDLGKLFIE